MQEGLKRQSRSQAKSWSGTTPRPMLWAGRVLSGLVVLFMLFDSITKLVKEEHVVKAMAELGFPDHLTRLLGLILLVSTILYAMPRTSILGAILLTAWLGGATAEKTRQEDASWLFSVVFGVLVWVGLYLRDARLRSMTPVRSGN
jgi:hypothetical protein